MKYHIGIIGNSKKKIKSKKSPVDTIPTLCYSLDHRQKAIGGLEPAFTIKLHSTMDTLQFEMEAVPVRTLALPELLECYKRDRNNDPLKNPLDSRDENHTDRSFALTMCFDRMTIPRTLMPPH
jgi:hypothetical protein